MTYMQPLTDPDTALVRTISKSWLNRYVPDVFILLQSEKYIHVIKKFRGGEEDWEPVGDRSS